MDGFRGLAGIVIPGCSGLLGEAVSGVLSGLRMFGIMLLMRLYVVSFSFAFPHFCYNKLISSFQKQDFSANTVTFHHSTGSDPLVKTAGPISASTSSNGADWHLGVLELPVSGRSDANEDFYFSGVYIESGSLTTSVAGPGGVVATTLTTKVGAATSSAASEPSTVPDPAPEPVPAGTLTKYSQVC